MMASQPFQVLMTFAGIVAGAIASVAGFGIGSILTPLLSLQVGAKVAVAAVSIPHAAGTTLRLWLARRHVDRRVLLTFGITSAAGGLAGALLHTRLRSIILAYVLGTLLIFAGVMGLTGQSRRMRFGRRSAWAAGALSGIFGGLVGNQGGIRSAAMLGFQVQPQAFVATATAIALMVDAARVPVYAATQARQLGHMWFLIVLGTAGVVAGTITGQRMLGRIPEPVFRRIVSAIILALGVSMFFLPGA